MSIWVPSTWNDFWRGAGPVTGGCLKTTCRDIPIEEIARMRGISYTAVRIRLLRARRSVQSRIKEREPGHRVSRLKQDAECQIAA